MKISIKKFAQASFFSSAQSTKFFQNAISSVLYSLLFNIQRSSITENAFLSKQIKFIFMDTFDKFNKHT